MDNRRQTIVINKKFQYQYSLLIAALAVLLVNGFIILRVLFPGEQPLFLSVPMALSLATIELVLVGSIWYASLRASHRIAGPVYVFTRELERVGAGDLTARVVLRDNDMFRPEGILINNSIAALRDRVSASQKITEQLIAAQAQGGELGPLLEQLASAMSSFNTDPGE